MDSMRLLPSKEFMSVLEELKSVPGAPENIVKYFTRLENDKVGDGKKDHELKEENSESDEEDSKTNKEDSKTDMEDPKTDEEDSKSGASIEEDGIKVEEVTADKLHSKLEEDHFPSNELLLRTRDVMWCHQQIKQRGISARIHQLINQSEMLYPQQKVEGRDPELEARVNKLRAEQENRVYQDMTKNLRYQSGNQGNWSGVGKEMREMQTEVNRQMIAGLQYLVSIVGTFFALFVGMGFYDAALHTRLLTSLFAAVVVGIAELYFIIREDMRLEEQQKKIN